MDDVLEVTIALTDDEKPKYPKPDKQLVPSVSTPDGWGRVVVTRGLGEGIDLVEDGVTIATIYVAKKHGNQVRLHVMAPKQIFVHRTGLVDQGMRESARKKAKPK